LGYHPSEKELEIHNSSQRVRIVGGGQGAGKSLLASKEIIKWILDYGRKSLDTEVPTAESHVKEKGLWWLVGPTYDLCRPEFSYLLDDLHMLDIKCRDATPKVGGWSVTLPWGRVESKSTEDATKIAGWRPNGILVCEVAQLDHYAWLMVFGRAGQHNAPIMATGTFEPMASRGGAWYSRLWEEWQVGTEDHKSFSLPTWSNTAIYPLGREDPRLKEIEAQYPPDLFMERFGGIPSKPSTLVFKEFDATKHVVRMEMHPKFDLIYGESKELECIHLPWDYDVEIAVDPGYAGAYAVLALMVIDGIVYVFDEVYKQGWTAPQMIDECRGRSWWPRVKRGVIDVAGTTHQGLDSHEEIWASLAKISLSSQLVPIADGIERHRSFLASGSGVRLYYSPRCEQSIREYGEYKYRLPKEDRHVSEVPIDANNHAQKALCYFLVNRFGYVPSKRGQVWYISPFRKPPVKSNLPFELRT
jgi:hypothetical protein